MKILIAEERDTEFYYKIWLDTSKGTESEPEEKFVMEFHWGKDVPEKSRLDEMKNQAQEYLDKIAPESKPLKNQGKDL